MKTIKGLLGYVGFGVSAIISQGQQSLGPQLQKSGRLGQRREGHHDPVIYTTLIYAAELSILLWQQWRFSFINGFLSGNVAVKQQ